MFISKSDIDIVITKVKPSSFSDVLTKVTTPKSLIRVLSNYIYSNSVFGVGVAALASAIGIRSVISPCFEDSTEKYECAKDTAYEIAGNIFFAAIDEFNVQKNMHTHRTLAQATLKGMLKFFNISPKEAQIITAQIPATNNVIKQTSYYYGISKTMTDMELFRGIGFHLGSEILADKEFNELQSYLISNWSELTKHLKENSTEIHGKPTPLWTWIDLHTIVEIEHFDAALNATNKAIENYNGSQVLAKTWILEGLNSFCLVQSEFFSQLGGI